MKILIDKSFEKDVDKIKDKKILLSVADCIEEIQSVSKLNEITNCKKLKGSRNAYRIRVGDFRIGLLFENQTIKFIRFIHRSKIYNFFP